MVYNAAFNRFYLLPHQLAAVFGQPFTIRLGRRKVGVGIVLVRADCDGAQGAECDKRPPAAAMTYAVSATPRRVILAADDSAAGAARGTPRKRDAVTVLVPRGVTTRGAAAGDTTLRPPAVGATAFEVALGCLTARDVAFGCLTAREVVFDCLTARVAAFGCLTAREVAFGCLTACDVAFG